MSRSPARLSEEKKEKINREAGSVPKRSLEINASPPATSPKTFAGPVFLPTRRCEHYYCRCMMAAELAAMDMLDAAIEVHFKRVPCRVKGDT